MNNPNAQKQQTQKPQPVAKPFIKKEVVDTLILVGVVIIAAVILKKTFAPAATTPAALPAPTIDPSLKEVKDVFGKIASGIEKATTAATTGIEKATTAATSSITETGNAAVKAAASATPK